jgi:DNA-binding CsgD family transcriptional regulator
MEDFSSFSRLIETIYDASLDADIWPKALEQACAFVQGCSAVLYYQGIGDGSSTLVHTWMEDPLYLQLYNEQYSKLNPLHPSTLFLEVGKVYALGDLIPLEEFRASRLYREWAKPQGILDALNVIGKVVDFHKANAAALSTTLDGLDDAVFLVAPDGRLVHLNAPGSLMLTEADIFRAPQGRLVAIDPRVDAELQEAIAGAARGDAGLGLRGSAIALEAAARTARVAHVLSLVSGQRRDRLHSQAVAAIFIRRTSLATPDPLEVVTQRYGLTAAEVRVLAALTVCTGVADMARMLGIGEPTVKSHLQRLFAKTGARRQSDLIKLLASHGTPFGP